MMQKYLKTSIFIIIIFSLFVFSAQPSLAALNFGDATSLTEKGADSAGVKKSGDPAAYMAAIVSALLSLVGVIFFVLFIYGSFIWMTAAGNEEKVGTAKKIITSAIVGMAIVSLAYIISTFIIQALERPTL